MGGRSRNWANLRWGILPLAVAAVFIGSLVRSGRFVHANQAPPPAVKDIKLGAAKPGTLYAMTLAVKDPTRLQGNDAVLATVKDAAGVIDSKWLHTADLDLYLTLRPRAAGPVTVSLSSSGAVPEISTSLRKILEAAAAPAIIAAAPNDTWQTAQPFEFGQTIYGSDDERPYAPSKSEDGYAAMIKGFQWFKFTFKEPKPRLVYFTLNVTDRDVPLDVDIFKPGKDDVVSFTTGEFVYQVEATQNYPGLYKFRTRILEPGQEYYVRIAANHPAFQLHTSDFPIPPYTDPHLAVRAGMDFLVNMGDSWLSNTPRRGAIALRTTMQHSETQLCIACHPAQFTTRGYLTAVHNGYPPRQRASLEFLTDRIYNNARPLYGEANTNWVRVIYTARTVSSRLPLIAQQFEQNVTHDPPRKDFSLPYAEFLKIHYKGLTVMPGDEADGCEPDVSPFEIATQSWQTFDMVYKQTHGADWAADLLGRDAEAHHDGDVAGLFHDHHREGDEDVECGDDDDQGEDDEGDDLLELEGAEEFAVLLHPVGGLEAGAADQTAGPGFQTTNWMEQNRELFRALKLEQVVTFIVLALIVVVAALNILIALTMMVMEKTRDIAVMMSFGVTAEQVRRIFLLQGLLISAIGTTLGVIVGYVASVAGGHYRFIHLDASVYSIDYLPFAPRIGDALIVAAVSLGMALVATLYPSSAAASVLPAEALRYE